VNKSDKEKLLDKWEVILGNVDPLKEEWMKQPIGQINRPAYQVTDSGKTEDEWKDMLLPISKNIAAQTIGLDLLAVKPMSAPIGFENEKDRLKRETENKRIKLRNKIKKVKSEGNFVSEKLIESPSGLEYLDFKYGNTNSNSLVKSKKKK